MASRQQQLSKPVPRTETLKSLRSSISIKCVMHTPMSLAQTKDWVLNEVILDFVTTKKVRLLSFCEACGVFYV